MLDRKYKYHYIVGLRTVPKIAEQYAFESKEEAAAFLLEMTDAHGVTGAMARGSLVMFYDTDTTVGPSDDGVLNETR